MKEPFFTITYLSILALAGIGITFYKLRHEPRLLKRLIAGHLMVNLPAVVLVFGLPFLMYFLFESWVWRIVFMLLTLLIGFALAWVNWSLFIPKWRLWAFRNLDDDEIIKLEKLAVEQRLIWQLGHHFEQTEVRSKKDQPLIVNIQERIAFLKEVENIKLDLGLERERTFTLNRRDMWLEVVSKTFLLVIGVGGLLTANWIIGLLILLPVVLSGSNKVLYKNLVSSPSYLTFSETGLRINFHTTKTYNWGEIRYISVDPEDRALYLDVLNKKKPVKISLAQFDIKDYEELVSMVNIYVDRYIARREAFSGSLN